jgi:NAD(P)-dependent dehydrogenase (short-subunit alcohol dehydrogenase family)
MATRPEIGAGVADVDLSGRTVLVTGATSGVGRETALALGRLGARMLVHGRDRERGAAVVERLRAAGSPDPAFFRADFLSLDDVRDLADEVADRVSTLDVLVNNAGAQFPQGGLTQEGIERTFAVNHLAPFLLTNRLLGVVPPDGRIVTVSSETHRRPDRLDLEEVRTVAGYDGFAAYSRSKLANVLFTVELARRLDDRTANCCHPGFVPRSALWRESALPLRALMTVLGHVPSWLTGRGVASPAQGAETSVYLAASPAVADVTGRYFVDCEPVEPAPLVREADAQRDLWEFSAEVVGLGTAEMPGTRR